jgi:hypothetical protein
MEYRKACALNNRPVYLAAFSVAGFATGAFAFTVTGLDLPNEPLNIFPFFVFLSPRPIEILFI